MYNCAKCKNTSQRTEKQHKIIVKTRIKKYYHHWVEYKKDGTPIYKKEFVGEGSEIVKEIIFCTACKDRYDHTIPDVPLNIVTVGTSKGSSLLSDMWIS